MSTGFFHAADCRAVGAPERVRISWRIAPPQSCLRVEARSNLTLRSPKMPVGIEPGNAMLRRIFDRIAETLETTDPGADGEETRRKAIRHATAVLMIDVARADNSFDNEELARIVEYAHAQFGLSDTEAAELVAAAAGDAEDLVSLHEFTQLLHNNLSDAEKHAIVATLWHIAYADGNLDKYENSLVLKISDGLHVARGRCMRLKHDAAGDG